jgi:hypothetical protein
MSLLEHSIAKFVAFEGDMDSSVDVRDLVSLDWTDTVAQTGSLYCGMELVSLQLGLAASGSPTTNEHFGMELLLFDATFTEGTQGVDDTDSTRAHFAQHVFTDTSLDWNINTGYFMDSTLCSSANDTTAIHFDSWNVQIPYQKVWLPSQRPSSDLGISNGPIAISWRIHGTPSQDLHVRGAIELRSVGDVQWD